jgi:hypothetical protein
MIVVVSVERWFLVVSGPPASGKSTVAPWIAAEFGLPLVAKDTVKDALMSVLAVDDLAALPGPVIEVFCSCDRDVAALRYRTRAGTRHAGHFDRARTADELWNGEISEPVAGGWPVLNVDTNGPVDLPAVADRIRTVMMR